MAGQSFCEKRLDLESPFTEVLSLAVELFTPTRACQRRLFTNACVTASSKRSRVNGSINDTSEIICREQSKSSYEKHSDTVITGTRGWVLRYADKRSLASSVSENDPKSTIIKKGVPILYIEQNEFKDFARTPISFMKSHSTIDNTCERVTTWAQDKSFVAPKPWRVKALLKDRANVTGDPHYRAIHRVYAHQPSSPIYRKEMYCIF